MILSDALVEDVKALAARRQVTMTALVDEALRAFLRQQEETLAGEATPPFRFRGYGSAGLLPGVDLNDSAALLDLMEKAS